jgi:pyruvate dehydrogenase E1 component alpha subunit
MGPHTTADDPDRYRHEAESGEWVSRDPLARVRSLLERQGAWTEEWQAELEAEASANIETAVEWAEAVPPPTFEEMINRMYAELTPGLLEQWYQGRRELPSG